MTIIDGMMLFVGHPVSMSFWTWHQWPVT